MDERIIAIAARLRGMREITGLTVEQMAAATGVPVTEYTAMEKGTHDFGFTFLYKAAQRLGIDLTDLLSGESPRLTGYELIRAGKGLPITRRQGFQYSNLAYMFKNRLAEPFLVTAPYESGNETCTLAMSTHAGQEMDYVLSGTLRISINGKEEIMHAGDTVYYDASQPHGMVALDGQPCVFLAVVMGSCED